MVPHPLLGCPPSRHKVAGAISHIYGFFPFPTFSHFPLLPHFVHPPYEVPFVKGWGMFFPFVITIFTQWGGVSHAFLSFFGAEGGSQFFGGRLAFFGVFFFLGGARGYPTFP